MFISYLLVNKFWLNIGHPIRVVVRVVHANVQWFYLGAHFLSQNCRARFRFVARIAVHTARVGNFDFRLTFRLADFVRHDRLCDQSCTTLSELAFPNVQITKVSLLDF